MLICGGNPADVGRLEFEKRAVALSPEQILAISAKDSMAAANVIALQSKYKSLEEFNKMRVSDQQKFNQIMGNQYGTYAGQMTNIFDTAMSAMSFSNSGFKPYGNYNMTNAGGRICPNCGSPMPFDALFCPKCGRRV